MMQEALKEAIDHNDFDFPSCEFKLWAQNGGEKQQKIFEIIYVKEFVSL